MTSRRKGINYRRAIRKLNPELAAKLYPTAPLPRDVQDRLAEIAGEIDRLMQRRNAHVGAERLAELIAERRELNDGLNRPPDRHLTTRKSSESEGSRP